MYSPAPRIAAPVLVSGINRRSSGYRSSARELASGIPDWCIVPYRNRRYGTMHQSGMPLASSLAELRYPLLLLFIPDTKTGAAILGAGEYIFRAGEIKA